MAITKKEWNLQRDMKLINFNSADDKVGFRLSIKYTQYQDPSLYLVFSPALERIESKDGRTFSKYIYTLKEGYKNHTNECIFLMITPTLAYSLYASLKEVYDGKDKSKYTVPSLTDGNNKSIIVSKTNDKYLIGAIEDSEKKKVKIGVYINVLEFRVLIDAVKQFIDTWVLHTSLSNMFFMELPIKSANTNTNNYSKPTNNTNNVGVDDPFNFEVSEIFKGSTNSNVADDDNIPF